MGKSWKFRDLYTGMTITWLRASTLMPWYFLSLDFLRRNVPYLGYNSNILGPFLGIPENSQKSYQTIFLICYLSKWNSFYCCLDHVLAFRTRQMSYPGWLHERNVKSSFDYLCFVFFFVQFKLEYLKSKESHDLAKAQIHCH